MEALLFIGLLMVTLLHVHILSTVTATRIFCQAPAVSVGDPATLSCHFPEDLYQSRKSIGVARRDSVPGSLDEFLFGCAWDGENLRCSVRDGYQLITQQPTYDVTFQIPSHEPGTFHCDTIPPDEAVTIQSCSFTLKGSPPSTVTPSRPDSPTQSTERSEGRNEDGDRPVVTTIVLAVVLSVITAVAAIPFTVLLCRRRWALISFGAARFVNNVTESIECDASPLDPQHGTVESQPQVVEKEPQSFLTHNCSATDGDHGTDGSEPYNEAADDDYGTDRPEPYNEASDDALRVVCLF